MEYYHSTCSRITLLSHGWRRPSPSRRVPLTKQQHKHESNGPNRPSQRHKTRKQYHSLFYSNIVFLDENNAIKLGDFGLSRTIPSHETAFAQTYVGTPYYMSPEIISSLPYTQASDIWALGCVLYELMTHLPPFTAKTQMDLFRKIKEGTFPPLPRERKTGHRIYSVEIEEVVRYFRYMCR